MYILNLMYNISNSYNFYKKYHKNDINILIHIFCIPLIAWSLSVFLSQINLFRIFNLKVKANFLLVNIYLLIYTSLNNDYFLPMSIYLFLIYFTSELFVNYVKNYYYYAFLVHVFSWILQFIGHGVFEGNRPALTDSITQAFIAAPLFSYLDMKNYFNLFNN